MKVSLVRFYVLLVLMSVLGWLWIGACNCDTDLGRSHPTQIDFLKPRGTSIPEGIVQVKVGDLDGIVSVAIYVGDNKVLTKTFVKESEVNLTANFNLNEQPDEFVLKVETIDTLEEKGSKSLTVRKEVSPPSIRIVAPVKLDPKHNAIFVGKTFDVEAEADDPQDGVKKINLAFILQSKTERPLFSCDVSGKPATTERCKTKADVTDDKTYPEGALVIQAQSVDSKGELSRKVKLQVIVDKSGPQLKIISPLDGQQLTPATEFRVLALDQVGVKEMKFFIGTKELTVTPDSNKPGHYVAKGQSGLGSGTLEFKVKALDNLDNPSEASTKPKAGCQSDNDCSHLPNTRCCLSNSATNPDGSKNGQCFEYKTNEGDLCDPCTQPCGKGSDGKLMGCLPQPCTDKPPYRCRRACNLGNPNRRPDPCQPASGGQPAEYCTRSDITKFDPTQGSCAIGHKCDPLNPTVCPQGTNPPYNNCCPAGMSCFPADDDANFCVPEGNKKEGEQGCNNNICSGSGTCGASMVCVTPINQQGQPSGPARCNKMCRCDSLCRLGIPSQSNCASGQFCTPLVISNGRVPLPVGACTSP